MRLVGIAAALLLTACSGHVDFGDSTSTPVVAATATPTPVVNTAPSPPPPVVQTAAWSPAECAWAIQVLDEDAQLDQAAVGWSDKPDYYRTVAEHWREIASFARQTCGEPALGPVAVCTDALAWLAAGQYSHDAQVGGPNQAWNAAWSQAYVGLTGLVGRVCPHD